MNQPIRCAIIEDEPLAQALMQKFVRRVAGFQLVGTFDDAVAAYEQLPALRPDLIFVDINMPEMTGLELLRAYPADTRPLAILTTANPHHALDGFDIGVVDYLLKPIPFDRFVRAVDRAKERLLLRANADTGPQAAKLVANQTDTISAEFVYLKTDKKLEQVLFANIVFVESLGDYVKVFLPDRMLVTLLTMTKMAELLPADRFLRVNRSFIVQLRHIKTLNGNTLTVSTGHAIAIGPNYRDAIKNRLRQYGTG